MNTSIFEPRKGKKAHKKLSLIIPSELDENIKNIRAALEEKSPDLTFNVNRICEDALVSAVRKAKRELTQMYGNEAADSKTNFKVD